MLKNLWGVFTQIYYYEKQHSIPSFPHLLKKVALLCNCIFNLLVCCCLYCWKDCL